MKFSIGSWSFHELYEAGKMSVFGYLESIKYRYHLDSADIWTGMLASTEQDYIQKLQSTLAEEEISLACLATDAHIWHPETEVRRRNQELIRRYLDIAIQLRAQTLRLDLGVNSPQLTEEQFEYIVQQYRAYAAVASEHGFRIGPQTHQPAAQVPHNILRLAEAVDSPAFGAIIDVARWIEDEERGDALCAPHAMMLHFDSSRTTSREDIEQKVNLFAQSGYRGCWSLEYRLGGSEYLGVAADLAELRRAVHLATR